MLEKIRKSKFSKALAVYFIINILLPVSFFEAKAGSGNAGSAEFSPSDFGNLVDPFTGDFHYSIPLMEVAGPGGSYPIVIGYSSSSVNQEADAGWVGSGWSLNIGAVTREMKGLPDDFMGDEITKEYAMKEAKHSAFTTSAAAYIEEVGMPIVSPGLQMQLYNNSYTGFGMNFGASLGTIQKLATHTPFLQASIVGNLEFNFDTQKGYGFNTNFGLNSNFFDLNLSHQIDLRTGILNNTLRGSFFTDNTLFHTTLNKTNYVPGETLPIAYEGKNYSLKVGGEVFTVFGSVDGDISETKQRLSKNVETFKSAGYLYLKYAESNPDALMDYNRENDLPVTQETKTMGVPILQSDEYFVSGNDFNISFRPFRNDIGKLRPETRDVTFTTASDKVDAGPPLPTGWKAGYTDVAITTTLTTGPWTEGAADAISHVNFKDDEPTVNTLDEPVYFKSNEDITKSNPEFINQFGGYRPVNMNIAPYFTNAPSKPVVTNVLLPEGTTLTQYDSKRVSRDTYIKHEKVGDIKANDFYPNNGFGVWSTGNPVTNPFTPGCTTCTGVTQFSYPSYAKDHHIGKYKVTRNDGTEYDYGLPVYNVNQVEAYYTTSSGDTYLNTDQKISTSSTEASQSNTSGHDNFCIKNTIPAYTTNHLLTGIRGHDYVDLKNDGLTDDDMGYFMKFNYTKIFSDFKWRTPYSKSNYNANQYSNTEDNKASYTYGEKEVYYINSVESKTHIAVFILQDRDDACEPTGEYNNDIAHDISSPRKLKSLDKILLYKKNGATNELLQTVDFTYNYSLYPGVESNLTTTDGRLTLESIKITYLDNNKGEDTGYDFTYNSTGSYQPQGLDRWGIVAPTSGIANLTWENVQHTFQMQGDYNKDGSINSYDASDLTTNVSKGLLSKIVLPSKGEIDITYESDDYGYVQNKRPQQMVRILGTSKTDTDVMDTDGKIKKDYLRIYFSLPEAVSSGSEVGKYISGLQEVYFKTFQELRKPEGAALDDKVYDYVKGYAKVETSGYGLASGSSTIGYITLKPTEYGALHHDVHPFRKAGWQYLRVERTDLEDVSTYTSGTLLTLLHAFVGVVGDIPEIIGYYNASAIKAYCNNIQLTTFTENSFTRSTKPSFLRLNCIKNKKTGGGHRVNKITWKDNFAEGEQTLGQTFQYILPNGESSGVATSEPMSGKEDNVFSFPRYYVAEPKSLYKNDQNFIEGPPNESYFPSPSVGYSRVVIKNIDNTLAIPEESVDPVTKNNNGIDVYEFYTCKDFPVITDQTVIDHVDYVDRQVEFPKGYEGFEYHGYSQGFYCELNDMHGKTKSTATYKTGADLETVTTAGMDAPVHKREFKYFVDDFNKLINEVPCLNSDANYEDLTMGENYEFFIDMREHFSRTVETGRNYDLDGLPLAFPTFGVPIPTSFKVDITESDVFRGIATNKIVHKKGIIKEIVDYNEGEKTITTNLYFDPLTGDALLTKSNNSFNNPVYNYHYAGHWYYNNMKPIFENMNVKLFGVNGSGTHYLTHANDYLREGDQLLVLTAGANYGKILYATNVTSTSYELRDVDDNDPTLSSVTLKVIKSGNRNLQGTKSGYLQSLQNPVTDNTNVFLLFNQLITSHIVAQDYAIEDVNTCGTDGENVLRDASFSIDQNNLSLLGAGPHECQVTIPFSPAIARSTPYLSQFKFLSYSPSSGSIVLKDLVTGDIITSTLSSTSIENYETCWKSCFTVLNATAAEFDNGTWPYNYVDAGSPQIKTLGGSNVDLNASNGNDFHYGKVGFYRVKKNYTYQIGRKQTTPLTKIDRDGEFKEFDIFDWMVPGNAKWTWMQELTRVSPYGITLETSDRLGIYATNLVGFNNKVITAQAANSSYFETAFDGFEEHPLVSTTYTYGAAGHWNFEYDDASNIALSTTNAHTGKLSAAVTTKKIYHNFAAIDLPSIPTGNYFDVTTGKKYLASAWFLPGSSTAVPVIKVHDITDNTDVAITIYDQYPTIENWKKIEIGFEITNSAHSYRIEIYLTNGVGGSITSGLVDDIRIHPFKAAMTSSVYDPITLWKVAELDNQNFATFYNYDEEGNVIQVKKETINGVVTISTARGNINLH